MKTTDDERAWAKEVLRAKINQATGEHREALLLVVGETEACEFWQPVEHREGRGVDLRSYSVWVWDREPVPRRRWSAWDLPPLSKSERRWAP